MLSQSEFNILYYLVQNNNHHTQREISEAVGLSLGKTNQVIRDFGERGLIKAKNSIYEVTAAGFTALKPYKVDNAIIMAAGMSTRFAPLSYEKPKGLLIVKNEVLIEREIRQLQEVGIDNIIIVVGYMKEKFFYLEEKFGVHIVVNEDYYKYNNTSTLIRVKDKLSNTYICSSDNYFVDNVFEPYVYRAYYAAVYEPGKTDEYCLSFSQDGRINNVTVGGESTWYMLGHVYFDRNFSKSFKEILIKEYDNPITKEQLWEDLYIRYIKQLDLYIKKYDSDKVKEFDSLEELRSFDNEYINNADSEILRHICKVLNCEIKDIVDIKSIKAGLTNTSFQFCLNDDGYVYRHPGRGTEKYINRKSESYSMQIASELGLDDTFIYMDEDEGWKISKFIKNARELDYHNDKDVDQAIRFIRKLHGALITSEYDFGIWKRTLEFIDQLNDSGKTDFEDFHNLFTMMSTVNKYVSCDKLACNTLCHNDCYSPNFLIDDNNKMYLIDWEYSGNDDPASDIGTFVCCSDYTYDESLLIIRKYLDHEPDKDELIHYLGYISIASYYWYVWALYQETRGNSVGEWLYLWYKNSRFYAKKVLHLIS